MPNHNYKALLLVETEDGTPYCVSAPTSANAHVGDIVCFNRGNLGYRGTVQREDWYDPETDGVAAVLQSMISIYQAESVYHCYKKWDASETEETETQKGE